MIVIILLISNTNTVHYNDNNIIINNDNNNNNNDDNNSQQTKASPGPSQGTSPGCSSRPPALACRPRPQLHPQPTPVPANRRPVFPDNLRLKRVFDFSVLLFQGL